MINGPMQVVADSFQHAWLDVVNQLESAHWELNNVVAHIRNITAMDQGFHSDMESFAEDQAILGPKHVAYTIFPHGLYRGKDAEGVFEAYNRPGGFYDRKKTRWGTYFRRMTSYKVKNERVNQLKNIIDAIRDRETLNKAAYTVTLQYPGKETIRKMGGPCLNYLAIQAKPARGNSPMTLGLMAVYRNHDFLQRAYGNYWGLCNLIGFLAREVGGRPGPLTCVSSHAYVSEKKTALRSLKEVLS